METQTGATDARLSNGELTPARLQPGLGSWNPFLPSAVTAGIDRWRFDFVTFNKVNTYAWFKENIVNLDEEAGWAPNDRAGALSRRLGETRVPTGLFYAEEREAFHKGEGAGVTAADAPPDKNKPPEPVGGFRVAE